jgi:hypothetical protein
VYFVHFSCAASGMDSPMPTSTILLITSGTYEEHLAKLDQVFYDSEAD